MPINIKKKFLLYLIKNAFLPSDYLEEKFRHFIEKVNKNKIQNHTFDTTILATKTVGTLASNQKTSS